VDVWVDVLLPPVAAPAVAVFDGLLLADALLFCPLLLLLPPLASAAVALSPTSNNDADPIAINLCFTCSSPY
jgi:hypothetical protein